MTSKVWIGLVFVGKNILTFIRSNAYVKVGRGGYARLALRTRGLGTRVPRSNPGAATFALFAKLRKRDFRRLHPQV